MALSALLYQSFPQHLRYIDVQYLRQPWCRGRKNCSVAQPTWIRCEESVVGQSRRWLLHTFNRSTAACDLNHCCATRSHGLMKRSRSTSSSSAASYTTAADDTQAQAIVVKAPESLARGVSPPPIRQKATFKQKDNSDGKQDSSREPTTAQVEAGLVDVDDHVAFFSSKLATYTRPCSPDPRLDHADWLDLYHRNQSSYGHHFVIHQHDHPIAGTHYDLRLQINSTSSISFAIMYGLPGDPNSRRLNRNATETRVHCLWVRAPRFHCLRLTASVELLPCLVETYSMPPER